MTHCDIELQAFFAGGLCREKPPPFRGPCIKEPGGDIGGRLSIDPTRPLPVATRHARRADRPRHP